MSKQFDIVIERNEGRAGAQCDLFTVDRLDADSLLQVMRQYLARRQLFVGDEFTFYVCDDQS